MKTITALLLSACLTAAQSTGDYIWQKKTASGYAPISITPQNGKILSWNNGSPVNIDPPPATAWGAITGTLANQTDLNAALNAKANADASNVSGAWGDAWRSTINALATNGSAASLTNIPASQLTGFLPAGNTTTPSLQWGSAFGLYNNSGSEISLTSGGGGQVTFGPSGVYLKTTGGLAWSSSSTSTGTKDTFLNKDAAATIQLGNDHATTPITQTIKAHDVTTGAGAKLTLSSGAGSVTAGALSLATGGVDRVTVTGDGAIATTGGITVSGQTQLSATQALTDSNSAVSRGLGDARYQSDRVGFLDRFDRYPVGTIFQHGTTTNGGVTSPEVGNPWRFSQATKAVSVVAATDIFTSTGHAYPTGTPVQLLNPGGNLPAPGVNTTTYFVIRIDDNTFKLATSAANATAGTAIDFTNVGTATGSLVIGAGPMITADGGLRFYPGELGYLGSDAGEDIKSITLELAWEVNNPAGISRNGLTFAFSKDPILNLDRNGISTTNIIHTQTTIGGITTNDIYGVTALGEPINPVLPGSAGGEEWNDQLSGGGVPFGRKYTITIEFEGDEMRVIQFGRIHRWKNPAIAAAGYRHWWIEAYGVKPTVGETPTFYRVWVNAPKLDHTPGWGAAQNSKVLTDLSSSGPVELPHRIIRMLGSTSILGNQASGPTLVVGGASYSGSALIGGGILSDGKIRVTPPGVTEGAPWAVTTNAANFTAYVQSDAASADAFKTINGLGPMFTAGKMVGDGHRVEVWGTFGANANVKRIKFKTAFTSDTKFDSGDITQSGGMWHLVIHCDYIGANSHCFLFEFETFNSSGTKVLDRAIRGATDNFGNNYWPYRFHFTGTDLGDVTVIKGTNEFFRAAN